MRNTTVYTKEAIIKFSDHITCKQWFIWWTLGIATGIEVLYLFLCALGMASLDDIALLIYIPVTDITMVCLYFIKPRITVKKSKLLDTVSTYLFEEDQFQTESDTEEYSEKLTMKYKALHSVVQKGDYLYLMIAKNAGYIVNLEEFSKAERNQLERMIRLQLDEKKIDWK